MSELSTNLSLPYLAAAQAQKHVTHNEALRLVDAICQLSAISRTIAAPPSAPAEGDRYIVAAAAGGDWSGRTGLVAAWLDGVWEFLEPKAGWIAWVEAEAKLVVYAGDTAGWTDFATAAGFLTAALVAAGVGKVGVNTAADVTNRLAVKSDAALFSHDDVTPGTGDMRLTVNKASSAKDAGFVLQDGWSTRALLGLLGTDDFALKVSADGASFVTALSVARATGALSLAVDLPVSEGGTGASTRAKARWNLGFRPDVPKRRKVTGASWLSSTSVDYGWRGVCWAAELGLFCAVSDNGAGSQVMTSQDGITWTSRTTPSADTTFYGVCWSPELGLFCAVSSAGTGDRVMTSPDGITWTSRTSAADNNWYDVCWSPERGFFVAVAASGTQRVMTSPDGINWTPRTAPSNNWFGVCWSAELGLFCAVANSGTGNRVMTSPDGLTWTSRTSAADNNWLKVVWAAQLGLFVAVGESGTGNRVMTSPDGITWTSRTTPADNSWRSVAWAPDVGLLAAVAGTGSGSDRLMTSPDGIVWTLRGYPAENAWNRVCWSPELGLFCAVSGSGTGNRVMTSVSAHSLVYRS